jgi:hypothetical protein
MATRAPVAPNASAQAAPIPDSAPVTITVRSTTHLLLQPLIPRNEA